MAEVNEGGYFIALQYADQRIKELEKELRVFNEILESIQNLERHEMISVESSLEATVFQNYKGKLAKLKHIRKPEKKRSRELEW